MLIKFLNIKILFFTIFLFFSLLKNVFSEENYIVAIVNKMPITKFDIVEKAKLISISINQKFDIKNLNSFYNQSLKTLINEKIIFSAGSKINKNLDMLVAEQAKKSLLDEFENSRPKLERFVKKHSISESTLLEKHKAQIIWGLVLRNKYKLQFSKIEKNIEQTFELRKKNLNEDLYDLAEIVIEKKNNNKLLKNINAALKDGASFLDIAKQVSISNSSKFNGKIGWKNFDTLPKFLKNKKVLINEGDVFSFPEKDKIRIIKILAKRQKGKLSEKEDTLLLAQIKFTINFQERKIVYEKLKKNVNNILSSGNNCETLRAFENKKSKNLSLKVIKSRIADLSPKIQNIIKKINFLKISEPIFYGNNGYAYIKCDSRKAKLEKINFKKIKQTAMNKYFLIYGEKLIKRLNNEANIELLKKIK